MRKIVRFGMAIGTALWLGGEAADWSVCMECPIRFAAEPVGFIVIGGVTIATVFVFWMWLFDELKAKND